MVPERAVTLKLSACVPWFWTTTVTVTVASGGRFTVNGDAVTLVTATSWTTPVTVKVKVFVSSAGVVPDGLPFTEIV